MKSIVVLGACPYNRNKDILYFLPPRLRGELYEGNLHDDFVGDIKIKRRSKKCLPDKNL